MNRNRQTYQEEFEELISEIRSELTRLKEENQRLKAENHSLKQQLNNETPSASSGNGDIFHGVEENERLALRQQIKDLISRIDSHIGNSEEK